MDRKRLFGVLVLLLQISGAMIWAETNQHHLTPGFQITKVAGPPAIQFPMFAAVDEEGSLYVAESSGLDLYAEITAGTRKCRVSVLQDSNGDGTYEEAKVFADNLVFPMGLVARNGKLYVADPPELVTLEDTDADGRADRRTVIVSGFGHRDNGSLHGLTFGPDGWLYMTMGAPDGYKLKQADGTYLEGKSGALLRCRPDGSDIEVVCRGFENLVEVVFTHTGEMIGSDNWYKRPEGDGMRDALVHLVEGGLYPLNLKDEGTAFSITGQILPAIAMYPAVAVSGLQLYRGKHFPAGMHHDIFSAQHNARKVVRHKLSPDGATFHCENFEFLWSDDPDFHPSDVLEDLDGTLLVIDTGSWYVHHCPTGKIRQAPSKGGVYRVSHINRRKEPRTMRGRSTSEVQQALNTATNPIQRCDLIFALGEAGGQDALRLVREQLRDDRPEEAIAAAHVLARRQDSEAAPALVGLLKTTLRADVIRAAAEALPNCGPPSDGIATLLQLYEKAAFGTNSPDAFLKHALLYAIDRMTTDKELLSLLGDNSHASIQQAALRLLDQSGRAQDSLQPEVVIRLTESTSPELRETALQVVARRPQWLATGKKLIAHALESHRLQDLKPLLSAFGEKASVQELLSHKLKEAAPEQQVTLLDLFTQVNLRIAEELLAKTLEDLIRNSSGEVQLAALRSAGAGSRRELSNAAKQIAEDETRGVPVRLEAIRVSLSRDGHVSEKTFSFLLSLFTNAPQPLDRLNAGELLKGAALSDHQFLKVLKVGSALIPPESFLLSFKSVSSGASAEELVSELGKIFPQGSSLNENTIKGFSQRLPEPLRARAEKLLASKSDLQSRRARLEKFAPLLGGGNTHKGREVFYSAKAACFSCHAVEQQGGRAGPDLTKIGAVRSGHDLLESILFPSATFAQGFEPYLATTPDGREITGSLVRRNEQSSTLRDAAGNDMLLRMTELKEFRRLSLSLMPEGLEAGLNENEFRDLLAFLQSLK